jgi:hypothetical protein
VRGPRKVGGTGRLRCSSTAVCRHVREMLRIGHLDEAGTHAAAALPTILPIRIFHLRAAAHLHLSHDDAARENPPSGPRLWSLIC